MKNWKLSCLLVSLLLTQSNFLSFSLKAQTEAAAEFKATPKTQKMIHIEIWSDVMCPFCYIGKRKLEKALHQFQYPEAVEIIWKSYLLDPNLVSDTSKTIHQHLAQAKGWSLDYAREMGQYVTAMARESDLTYEMDKVKVANTFDAHRLIQYAKSKQKGAEIEELLFRAYFTEGKNLADREVLAQIASNAGLDSSDVVNMYSGKAYTKEVLNDLNEAEELGVNGVPFFVFNRKYAISGAQDVSVFLSTLNKAFIKE